MMERKFKRFFFGIIMMAVFILPVHILPVSAYTNDAEQEIEGGAETGAAEENAVVSEEKPSDTEKTPFSVSGNGQLADDIPDDGTKQFLTIQTGNGSTFFIVVDRSRDKENVYMLSPVDENDLAEFLDEKESEPEKTEILDAWLDEDSETETENTEPEPETENGGIGAGTLFALALLAAGGAGAYCYLKIVKPGREDEDAESENLEFSDQAAFIKDGREDDEEDYAENGDEGDEI